MLYELKQAVRRFGSRKVLNIPYLAFEAGKVYALIGPNGAGKTTLLNHLAFLDQLSSGILKFCNEAVRSEASQLLRLRRQVVLVDQSPILFSGTVFTNVEFGLKIRKIAGYERDRRVMAALERVGMAGFAKTEVHGLSGGEVKRVALARALVLEPDVLLCDEPTANVDTQHQEVIINILQQANSVRQTSVIFSTHYLSQSRRLADRTILLQNGRLAQDMGENTFTVRVARDAAGSCSCILAGTHYLPLQKDLAGGGASSALIHLDPQRLSLLLAADEILASGALPGTVISVAAENRLIRLVIDLGVPVHVLQTRQCYEENPPVVGQKVAVLVPEEALSVLSS